MPTIHTHRMTCDTCGESWLAECEPACTCPDGGRWMADRISVIDGREIG